MRTRREIDNDIAFNQGCLETWMARRPGWSGFSQAEIDAGMKNRGHRIMDLRWELLDVVRVELDAANNEDAALYDAIRRAEHYNYRNRLTQLRKERGNVRATIKHLNRERDELDKQLNQENNMPGAGPNAKLNQNHDIDESVTTPGTDPEEAVKRRIQLLKEELEARRTALQKHFDSAEVEIERLNKIQSDRHSNIQALSVAINAL